MTKLYRIQLSVAQLALIMLFAEGGALCNGLLLTLITLLKGDETMKALDLLRKHMTTGIVPKKRPKGKNNMHGQCGPCGPPGPPPPPIGKKEEIAAL